MNVWIKYFFQNLKYKIKYLKNIISDSRNVNTINIIFYITVWTTFQYL